MRGRKRKMKGGWKEMKMKGKRERDEKSVRIY